jgi:hypothetical protein
MSYLQDIVNALMGNGGPKLDTIGPNTTYDDGPTMQQNFRSQMPNSGGPYNVYNGENADKGYPTLDANTLMQLLNPGLTMGQKSRGDLPIIQTPDSDTLIDPRYPLPPGKDI